jgi:hypothetical protein
MSNIPLTAEVIASNLEVEQQKAFASALAVAAGAVVGVLASHGPVPTTTAMALGVASGLLLLAGTIALRRHLKAAQQFYYVSRSKEIAIQDGLAKQNPEVQRYVDEVTKTRRLIVADLPTLEALATSQGD